MGQTVLDRKSKGPIQQEGFNGAARVTENAGKYFSISPNNATDLPNGVCDGIWVGGGGIVIAVADEDASNVGVPFTVAANTYLPVQARRILATGTTATLLVAMY